METKHTPGPWTVGSRYGKVHTEIAGPNYSKAVAYCWTQKAINGLNPQMQYESDPEGEANAALIAAAPDLLGACNLALNNLAPKYSSEHVVIRALDEAIFKATGLSMWPKAGHEAMSIVVES